MKKAFLFLAFIFFTAIASFLLVNEAAKPENSSHSALAENSSQNDPVLTADLSRTTGGPAAATALSDQTPTPVSSPESQLPTRTPESGKPAIDAALLDMAKGISQEIDTAGLLLDYQSPTEQPAPESSSGPNQPSSPAADPPTGTAPVQPQPTATAIVINVAPQPTAVVVQQPPPPPPAPDPGTGGRMVIPAINVDAPITSVGLDANGNMDAPAGWFDIAWYQYGAKPGQPGSAVFAGHLDTNTGAPATFWDLNLLVIGDQVIYQAPDGQQLVFIVEETGLYPWDQVPLEKVFSRTGDPRIALITCGGLWSRQNRNYSHRTLVFARLSY